MVEAAIEAAEEACVGGSTGECAAAWDNVSDAWRPGASRLR